MTPNYATCNEVLPIPAQPTSALPGSPEKVRVMTERVANREQPFHPADATGLEPELRRYRARHQRRVF